MLYINSVYNGNIGTIWQRKVWIKGWYNSKIFVNIADFSHMIFRIQAVLILPDQNVLIPLDQSVSILFARNIF